MKKLATLLTIGAAVLGIQSASAALITLQTNFDTTFDNSLSAPYVGSATLSYTAPSALPDGVYGWNTLSGLAFSAFFPDEAVTFTQANLLSDSNDVSVVIVGSSFFFASPSGGSTPISYLGVNNMNGSAVFGSGNFVLSNEPVVSSTLTSVYRGTAFTFPLYFMGNAVTLAAPLEGTYGADRQLATVDGGGGSAAVPEPGQVAASLLLLGGIGGYAFVKRRKAAKAMLVAVTA